MENLNQRSQCEYQSHGSSSKSSIDPIVTFFQNTAQLQPDLKMAEHFLSVLSRGNAHDPFVFQTFAERDGASLPPKILCGTFEQHKASLIQLNHSGASVNITINQSDGRGRKNENITGIRAVFVDLDGSPLEPILQTALEPHMIIETSPGRYHAYWLVEDVTLEEFSPIQRQLAEKFSGDPQVCDRARVMRLPGYYHQKGSPYLCRILKEKSQPPFLKAQLIDALQLNLQAKVAPKNSRSMIEHLKKLQLFIQVQSPGCYLIRCPWQENHTGGEMTARYYSPNTEHPEGNFNCAFCEDKSLKHFEDFLKKGTGLPQLIIPGGSQTIQTAARQAGSLLDQTGQFFVRGNALVRIKQNNGDHLLMPISPAEFVSEIESVAQVMKRSASGTQPTILNQSHALTIIKAAAFQEQLPKICILAKCPILKLESGNLRIITGYDRASGILSYAKPPEKVSLAAAKKILLGLLADFKFATGADYARAVAALLTPALIFGQLLRARSPLITIEADQSQTGKGYLVNCIVATYNHTPKTITQRKDGLGGIEESLNKYLIEGASFISIDNVRGKIESPALESLMTSKLYLARIPYSPPVEIDPQRLILFLTSNKSEMNQDLANRACCIQLRKQPVGYEFKSFPEGDLVDHIFANQPLIFGAIVAIISAWIEQGCQQTKESQHDFRTWCRPLDWIVQNLFGLPPLMEGHRGVQQRMVIKQMGWLREIALVVLASEYANHWLRAGDILNLIEGSEAAIPGLKDANSLDQDMRTNALTSMGKDFSFCFKASSPVEMYDDIVDVLTLDDIQVQRRTVTEKRSGDSGPTKVKEYLFRHYRH